MRFRHRIQKLNGRLWMTALVLLIAPSLLWAAAPPETPQVIPLLAELAPAQEVDPGQIADLDAYNLCNPELPAIGFYRAFEFPAFVDFERDPLPEDLPAAYAQGRISLENGHYVWTALVEVHGAKSVGLLLTGVEVPEETVLTVFAPGEPARETFGLEDVDPEGNLWTPVAVGPVCVLSLSFPEGITPRGQFAVEGVQDFQVAVTPGTLDKGLALLIPAPPTNLTATATGPTQVTLAWHDNSSDETGFKIQRKVGGGKFKKIATIGSNMTSFVDNSVIPSVAYTYRVKSFNSSGASPSNWATVTPGLPGSFTLSGTSDYVANLQSVRLTWTPSNGAVTYDVYKSGSLLAPGLTGTTYDDSAVSPGQTLSYYVQAKSGYGATNSNTFSVTVPGSCCQGPPAPTLTASAGCSGNSPNVSLGWTSSSGATSYDVYRGGVLLTGGISGLSYTDATVSLSQTYSYYVTAKNSCSGTNSNTVNVTMPGSCCTTPGGFTLSAWSECVNSLPSAKFEFTSSAGAQSYTAYLDGVSQPTPLLPNTTYYFTNQVVGSTHTVFIRATNSCGPTDSNNTTTTVTSCSTLPGNFTLTAYGECYNGQPAIRFSFTSSSNATSYVGYVNGAQMTGATLVPNTDFHLAGLTAGATYSIYIVATNSYGSTNSNTVTTQAGSCGSVPGSFTVTASGECYNGQAAIQFSFTASYGATSSTGYVNGGQMSGATLVPGTTFHLAGLTAGSTYSIYIKATNSYGSTNSNTVNTQAGSCCPALGSFTVSAVGACNGSTRSIRVSFTASANASSYSAYADGSLITGITPTPGVQYFIPVTGTHNFYVIAHSNCGAADRTSNTASATAPSSCP